MKCPHCGKFVPTPLDQHPLTIPKTTPERWPLGCQFMSLVFGLDGNVRDAVLLCLLAENQVLGHVATVRELAARSGNFLNKDSLAQLKNRVTGDKIPRVLEFTPDNGVRVNLPLVKRMAEEQAVGVDPAFLWFYELTEGCFSEALVLSLLHQAGADREAKRFTGRDLLKLAGGVYTTPREVFRAISRIAPIWSAGIVTHAGQGYLALNTQLINSHLSQQTIAWLDEGAKPSPWEAGLRLILSQETGAATSSGVDNLAQS